MRQQNQKCREPTPGNGCDMPSKPERSFRKLGASKKLWKICPPKQAKKNVSLAEVRMSNTNCSGQKCSEVQEYCHKQLNSRLTPAKRLATPELNRSLDLIAPGLTDPLDLPPTSFGQLSIYSHLPAHLSLSNALKAWIVLKMPSMPTRKR